MMYDIGVNLYSDKFKDKEKIIKDSRKNGVEPICTGTSIEADRFLSSFSRKHNLHFTCGIHPHNADTTIEKDFKEMEEIINKNKMVVAVGECGLDFDRMFSKKENQIKVFERQISIAKNSGLPLFLHERGAFSDFVKIMSEHPEICKHSIVHCFTGQPEHVEKYLDMGFYIGITGWICDEKRSEDLRMSIKRIPLSRILIETDSPYLIPRKYIKGSINVPQNVKYVAAEISKQTGFDLDAIIYVTNKNTEEIFNINKRS